MSRRAMAMRPHRAAEVWNERHAVGTRVRYWRGRFDRPSAISHTVSEAEVVCGTAVVYLAGVVGFIALSRVRPAEVEQAPTGGAA